MFCWCTGLFHVVHCSAATNKDAKWGKRKRKDGWQVATRDTEGAYDCCFPGALRNPKRPEPLESLCTGDPEDSGALLPLKCGLAGIL